MPLIVLRPEPGAGQTVARAEAMGLAVRCHSLFAAQPLNWGAPPPDKFDALLVTSAQTARLGGPALDLYASLPTYAVGEATAAALHARGFGNVVSGSSDGTAIAAQIATDGHRAVLHLAGDMVAAIDAGPLRITRVAVYTMAESQAGDALRADIAAGAIILVHSPRAAARLAELAPMDLRAASHVAAISPAALNAAGQGWASASAADLPRDDRVLALAVRLCEDLGDRAGKRAT
ncbi:MAG: uroporphyrinogen-III synthase [Sphingobium sp.]